jgi:hypothetical protein
MSIAADAVFADPVACAEDWLAGQQPSGMDQIGTFQQSLRRVQFKKLDGGSAYGRDPHNPWSVKSKVVDPRLSSWIEEASELARRWIIRANVARFAAVARQA